MVRLFLELRVFHLLPPIIKVHSSTRDGMHSHRGGPKGDHGGGKKVGTKPRQVVGMINFMQYLLDPWLILQILLL